jgi:hypothetical protein
MSKSGVRSYQETYLYKQPQYCFLRRTNMSRILDKSAIIILPLVILLLFTSKAYAEWYAWYDQGDYYGVWATIQSPTVAPYTPPDSGQSHSVTTPGPYWMQAGWLYGYGDAAPTKYYEYCAENCENDPTQYHKELPGSQTWGSGVKYEVSYDGSMGNKTWRAWVGGIRQICIPNIQTAPVNVMIQSEIHRSPRTEINTEFRLI